MTYLFQNWIRKNIFLSPLLHNCQLELGATSMINFKGKYVLLGDKKGKWITLHWTSEQKFMTTYS